MRAASMLQAVIAGLSLSAAALQARAEPGDDMPGTISEDPALAADMPTALPDDEPPRGSEPEYDPEKLPIRFDGNFVGALALQLSGAGGPAALGFGITYGVGWGTIPLTLGVDYMTTNASGGESTVALEIAGEPSVAAQRSSDRDRTHYFDLWLRVQPPRWRVRPYLEGFIGTRLLQTRYSVMMAPADSAIASDPVTDDAWSGSYGWGAGVDLWGLFKAGNTISLTFGVRQLRSGTVDFARTLIMDGRSMVAHYSVATNVFMVTAGIVGHFDFSEKPDPYPERGL